MRWHVLLLAGLLLAGCGQGTRVRVMNSTGADITAVSLTLGTLTSVWESIPSGDTVTRNMVLEPGGEWTLTYASGSVTVTDSNSMPDSSNRAKEITIIISGESTGVVFDF
jgi:hypothetical protein